MAVFGVKANLLSKAAEGEQTGSQLFAALTNTDICTHNRVKYPVIEFIFTSLGISHYDKPTVSRNLFDDIDP